MEADLGGLPSPQPFCEKGEYESRLVFVAAVG